MGRFASVVFWFESFFWYFVYCVFKVLFGCGALDCFGFCCFFLRYVLLFVLILLCIEGYMCISVLYFNSFTCHSLEVPLQNYVLMFCIVTCCGLVLVGW